MTREEPVAELDGDFSSPGAKATPWAEARDQLEASEILLVVDRPPGRATARHAARRDLA